MLVDDNATTVSPKFKQALLTYLDREWQLDVLHRFLHDLVAAGGDRQQERSHLLKLIEDPVDPWGILPLSYYVQARCVELRYGLEQGFSVGEGAV